MVTRSQKIRLGVFVVLASALLAGMVVILLGASLGKLSDVYTTRFEESVSGLELGAPVKYHGVRVGTVDAIVINPDDVSEVIVTLTLDHGTPIKADSQVVLNTMGITGLKFLEIMGGTDETRFLTPGEEIPSGPSLIHRLTGKADVITEKVEMLVNNLVEVTGEQQREQLNAILADVQETMESVRRIVAENEAGVSQAVKDLSKTAENLRGLSADAKVTLAIVDGTIESVRDGVLVVVDEVSEILQEQNANLGFLIANVDDAVLSAQKVIGSDEIARLPRRIDQTVVAARDLLTHADGHVGAIKDQVVKVARTLDGRIGDPRVDEVLDHVAGLSKNADELVQTLDLTARQSRLDIFVTLDELKDVVRNLNDFTQMLLENPSVLLRGNQQQERKL
jgi:phospholipid/cholesterol/gamma-HCH transport system substrate-binding protein